MIKDGDPRTQVGEYFRGGGEGIKKGNSLSDLTVLVLKVNIPNGIKR